MDYKSNNRRKKNIDNPDENRDEKIKLLKIASTDTLFLSDINEVTSGFENSDNELT